jgi:hypothetical protein
MTQTKVVSADAAKIVDVAQFDAADEAEMVVHLNGQPTTWVWVFAGPGHPVSVKQSSRIARERLREERLKEQARVNGRKWTPPDDNFDTVQDRNIDYVVERLLRWTPVRMGGEDLPFSPENARKLLADPRKTTLLAQALEFLTEDESFTRRSATS